MAKEEKTALDDLAQREGDSIPGLQLIAAQEVGIPFYLVRVRAQLRLEVEAPPLHAVILRLVALRDRSLDELAQLLRLKARMVAAVVRDMERGRFVTVARRSGKPGDETISLQTTLRGTDLRQWLSQAQVHDALMAMDGLTGALMSVPGPRTRLPVGKLQELQLRPVMPLIDEPIHSDLVGSVFTKHIQVTSLGNLPKNDSFNATILDVLSTEIWYIRAQILMYGTDVQFEDFRLFWKQVRKPDWETALQEGELDDLRPIPTQPKPLRTDIPVQPTSSSNTKATPSVLTLKVWEHRPTMVKAIEAARTRLMIVSPWINADATDEHILRRIEDALRRGVNIHIGYGIADETGKEDKPPNPRVMGRLNILTKNKKLAGKLVLKRLVTHEKILLKDDDLYIVGSFNWLSFRGDKKRGLRKESSAVLQDQEVVRAAWDEKLKDFESD